MKVENCDDTFCAMFDEIGSSIADYVQDNSGHTIKELHGCVLDGELWKDGTVHFDLLIGEATRDDCDY